MAKPKADKPLTEAELTVLLKERFAAPEYAFIPQVRNGTGYGRRTTRTADALAMSLWPSRGLELWGFELKSERADWMREKLDPAKGEEIGKFCDRWWLVAGADNVVQQDDLFPPTWGLMVAKAGKLVVVREAPKLEAAPLDRLQVAAILRRAAECVVPRDQIDAEIARAKEKLEESLHERVEHASRRLREDLDDLRERVAEFEKASGLDLGGRWAQHAPDRLGEAVKFVLGGGLDREAGRLRDLQRIAHEVAHELDQQVARLPSEPDRKAVG